jgi:glucokinase
MSRTFAGLDLGGTKLAAAAFAENGEILRRESIQLGGREGPEVARLIVDTVSRLIDKYQCVATGVCVPGLYRSASGTVWAPNIPGWDDYPLLSELRGSLPSSHRVAIDCDRTAYILGETWMGSAHGVDNAIFIAVGTGIGAGILVDGRIVRGHGDVAGAIGWLALDRPFAPRFKQHGCFEDQASGPGLIRVARDLIAQDADYEGPLLMQDLSTAMIFEAHEAGDTIARKVIDNAIELWGMAAGNLVSIFNPEVIAFGGGIFGPAVHFLDRIKTEAKKWAQPIAIEQVRFTASTTGGDAGLLGAGRLAMQAHGGSVN